MKNLRRLVTFFFLVSFGHSLYGLGPLLTVFDKKWEVGGKTFVQVVEKSIEELKQRLDATKKAHAEYKAMLESTQKVVSSLQEQRHRLRGTELEYNSQKSVILNKTSQVLTEIVRVFAEIQGILLEHIKALEEYKQDPEFREKGFELEKKSIYSIEDFQRINSLVLNSDNELKIFKERLDTIEADSQKLKKNLALANIALADKKQEQRELKEQKAEARLGRKKFTLKQQGDLLDAEERLLTYKRDLAEARLKESDVKARFLEFNIKIASLQLEILDAHEEHILREMRIDQKDIDLAEQELKKQIQESSRLHGEYNRRIESLNLVRQGELEQINLVKERASVSDAMLEELYNWTYKPVTIPEWRTLLEVGRLHNHLIYDVDVRKDIYLAKVDQEKAKVTGQEVASLVITSWEGLINGKFDGATDALSKEIKKYEKIQADLESSLAALAQKQGDASRRLARNTRITEAIKERIKEFAEQRETTFKGEPNQFNRLGTLLKNEAFVDAQKRAELLTQLIELYSSISQQRAMTSKKIDMMLRVLQSKAQDKLVPPLWSGLKKFIPDMGRFISFLTLPGEFQESTAHARSSFNAWLSDIFSKPASFFLALLYLIAILVIYFLLRVYLLDFGLLITNYINPEYGFIHIIAGFFAVVIQFIAQYLNGIFLWSLLLLLVKSGAVNAYLSSLFYLFSIPFWLYYVNRFISYAKEVNRARDYPFASKKYQERFFFVLSSLLGSTVVLLFFQEALGKVLPQSDAPRILQAINFIIFQVSLILMISREQILRLIPSHTSLGKWIQEQVDRYYYLFLAGLIVIIVMSNPYIGFGTHFLYLIGRVALIMLLVPLLVAFHNKIKVFFNSFFFYSDDQGGLHDRFPYARTSYGLFIIGSFLFFSFLTLLLAANIWGFEVGFSEILSWLRRDLYGYTSTETGRRVAVNALGLIRVLLYIGVGIAVAFVINRFMLRRMFDLLLVKTGVQNIFLSLIRYIIVIVALIIGLRSIGLGDWLFYVLAILAGLGVAGKEIIADFIGYFMILIQRPLKIGDFVKIGPELIGVVRHLTLRSVILRRKNSVTVIIPNSYILNRPLTNWNYYRMYFAFEDIFLTVSYNADPDKVRELFLKVLDDNYEVLRNPAPIVRLQDFTENGFQFMIRGFLSHDKVLDQYDIASDIRLELIRVLREHGYEVGVPGRILRLQVDDKTSLSAILAPKELEE